MSKKDDLKKKSPSDLAKLLAEKRDALRTFRFSAAGSRVRNTKEGMLLRRSIARVLTELRAKRDTASV